MKRIIHVLLPGLATIVSCSPRTGVAPQIMTETSSQLVVVTLPDWTSTLGSMTRWTRSASGGWQLIDDAVPVVVGRTGVAWGVGFDGMPADEPRKHEGDGKAPAGIFPLDTAFGFEPRESLPGLRLPYVQLTAGTDCVDDVASAHYNTVVDKAAVTSVDWQSAERMREVAQYKIGVTVGYNKPPVKGRGSCIFLHIWNGPASHTAGCTAFDEAKLRQVMLWLDPAKRPLLVQMPSSAYDRMRTQWQLPAIGRGNADSIPGVQRAESSHFVNHDSALR
jgi:D-alanyl-D-alanine dipeptidase